MNNPLAYTDPTGYSRWTNFRDRYGKTILAIGVSVVLGPGGYYGAWVGGSKVATAAAAGFAAGGIMGGNLNSALAGAVSGALFGAAGAMTTPTSFASYAAHAAAGCASAAASGGSCGSGAAGAVVGKLFTNLTVASLGQSSPGAHFAGAVIGGGMGSLAAGGRFQDGAFSAGLGYLFNELGSLKDRGYPERDRRFYSADDGKVETLGWQNPKDEKEGYGFRIKIRTDADQSLFVYGHVDPSSLAVSQGTQVTRGQLLGQYASPPNGGATGPHLHFEWWSKAGTRLDPSAHLSTVMPGYIRTDWIRFRNTHPVTGKQQWHNGYDLIGPWVKPWR
jgi:hypothetical protein